MLLLSLVAWPTIGHSTDASIIGCSDGTREGFLDTATYPNIAGCSGGWSIPGIMAFNPGTAPDCPTIPTFDTLTPACNREAGNDSANPNGTGCDVADLCALGWHVCATSAEVMAASPTGCDAAAPSGTSLFFATRQSSTGCGICATGTDIGPQCTPASCNVGCLQTAAISNDVFGCGNIGAAPSAACAPLNAFSNNLCGSLPAPWFCTDNGSGLCEAYVLTKSSPDAGGVLCCKDNISGSPTATPTPVPALFVANSKANSVTAYPLNAIGDQAPENSISGADTGLGNPQGIAVDSSGSIYVTNSANNSITIYASTGSGDLSPVNMIVGANTGLNSPNGIVVDSGLNIYAANSGNNSVTEYSSGSNGNASPSATISGGSTALNNPQGIALDKADNVYVTNYGSASGGNDTVTVYAPGSAGNASPSSTISGASTGLAGPLAMTIDSGGNIYVLNFIAGKADSVTIYPPGSSGNSAPAVTITGNTTGLENSAGIAVDGGGSIYVTNDGSVNGGADTITKYPEGQNGAVQPFAVLSGPDAMLSRPAGLAIGPYFGPTPSPTPTAIASATGTATATLTATLTPTATQTATATQTGTPTSTTTATATATTTATATVTATATHTATASPTPIPEDLIISPASHNFGKVKVGHDKSVTFTLTNSAQSGPPINLESPVAFSVPATKPQVFGFGAAATNCPRRLLPEKHCQLTVQFVPAVRGVVSSTVTVFDDAANANQTIPLNGTGK